MPSPELIALAAALGREAERRGALIATAESCTGGLLATAITAVAGSSAWFGRGWVTYAAAAKEEELEVPPEIIAERGVVSEETAAAMARGAARRARADLSAAITGLAGPGGASPGLPVGTVCFGFALRQGDGYRTLTARRLFPGDRAAVRERAVAYALGRLTELLREPPAPASGRR